ncbi:MAG: biotin/lipoyl-binding protein [Myxococcales bacterium]|nr:biotin/lipoyl-binding protein [Myxococcales bacterium]
MKYWIGPDGGALGVTAKRSPSDPERVIVTLGERQIHLVARQAPDGMLLLELADGRHLGAWVTRDGQRYWVSCGGTTVVVEPANTESRSDIGHGGGLEAPMPGKVLGIHVELGQHVKRGDTLLVMEAMKMEHPLVAPFDGIVREIRTEEGEMVSSGAALVVVEQEEG